MSRGADRLARAARWLAMQWPAAIVLAFAAYLLWPVPSGVMPLSADHTVHLTRIVLTAERLLSTGSLSGWEPTWFFGFPLGELYPPLGDLLIMAIRALSLGLLDWPQAYALGFYLVFALQGLVLIRIARLFGLGPWPGLIAALLMLADAGFTREGGWMYTVYFGVWPQALATSLAWLGLGELARALGWRPARALVEPESDAQPREELGVHATALAGLCFAAALLAHPIALPSLAIGGALLLITLVPRAPIPWRQGLARCLIAALIGASLAAWWWVPMLEHKGWMASYGWLHAPLEAMLGWLKQDGRWAQRMPAAVGYVALAGVVLAALGAGKVARFVALFALVQWLLASHEAFWLLRLDRLSEGFTHIQYQRFLIGAKPGLFLCAGLAVIAPAGAARRLWLGRGELRRRWLAGVGAVAGASISAALALWVLADSRATMAEYEVGQVQTERVSGDPEFEAHYQQFLGWARAQWDAREQDYRIAIKTPRNSHLFMDAPIHTATPQYKIGFTPGDNFVHKPESGRREVLDALGVRWIVGTDRGRALPSDVARFGPIYVRAHRGAPRGLAWVEGEGQLEILEADLRGGLVRARVRGVHDGARVVFAIAGYPRWRLFVDGEALEWVEVPVWTWAGEESSYALHASRRRGELRGGKARGDDGSEPTLIAAELPPGLGEAELELRYVHGGGRETAAKLVSLLALIALGLALVGPWAPRLRSALAKLEAGLARAAHPLMLGTLGAVTIALALVRWEQARAREAKELLGWVVAGGADVSRAAPGPVKTDMLIRPAVILHPRPGRPAVVELELERLPARLEGWVGIDDDQAQQRGSWSRHDLRIDVRLRDAEGDAGGDEPADWSTIEHVAVPHEPGRVMISASTGAFAGRSVVVRIVDETEGKRVARLGLNLELGAPSPAPSPAQRRRL